MKYTPSAFSKLRIEERLPSELHSLTGPTLIRRLKFDNLLSDQEWLKLYVLEFDFPLFIRRNHSMVFGTETITALDYLKRVIERGDLIDVVARPAPDGSVAIDSFWIHIVYVGEPRDAGTFSRKEDGLFAMRAKAGEKAERIVAKTLRDKYGHLFDPQFFTTPGYFEIRYDGTKKQRLPDLKCLRCGLTFEVKKRNRDTRFRVSHSDGRPFYKENSDQGWHAFVFPDMKPRFLANSVISNAISNGEFDPGADRYDSWADVRGNGIAEMQPPLCSGS